MSYHRKAAVIAAAMAFVFSLPAAAQEVHSNHTVTRTRTVTPVPGHVSTNRVRVVHIKKTIRVPARPVHGRVVHRTVVTKRVHHTSMSR